MAVYTRPLSEQEMSHIYRLLESNLGEEVKKRLRIILYSSQGYKAPEITPKVNIHPKTIRKWIKVFERQGLEGLIKKKNKGGAPLTFEPELRHEIVKIATSRPKDLGEPFTTWSLMKLREYLIQKKEVSISHETIRQILKKEGISFKKTKTWMESNDPEFEVKKTESLTSTKIHLKTESSYALMSRDQLKSSPIPEVPGEKEEDQKERLLAIEEGEPETSWLLLRLRQAK